MAASSFKKIRIAATNNSPDFLLVGDWVAESVDDNYLKKLNAYVQKKGFASKASSELEFALSALSWVTTQWAHDGMNQPPKKFRALDILKEVHDRKARYRCVEYGLVLAEVLQSYGFETRTVALRSKDVAYGGFGQGHVAMEVWLNDLNKWAFLDPQFGAYLTAEGSDVPLNFYEAFKHKSSGKWDSLSVHFTPSQSPSVPKDLQEAVKGYKEFLKNYMGHMTVSSRAVKGNISLMLESQEMPITFQGGPSDNAVFTGRVELVYPELNRVSLLLSYKDQGVDFQKLLKDLKVETDDDYKKAMPAFAARPEFLVAIRVPTQTKVGGYEYRLAKDSNWRPVKGTAQFEWNPASARNYLEVRLVTKHGKRGPGTFVELFYE